MPTLTVATSAVLLETTDNQKIIATHPRWGQVELVRLAVVVIAVIAAALATAKTVSENLSNTVIFFNLLHAAPRTTVAANPYNAP